MNRQTIDIKFPIALNTYDDARVIKPDECVQNYNLIRVGENEIRAIYPIHVQDISEVTNLINGIFISHSKTADHILAFGTTDTVGKLLRIEREDNSVTVVKDDLGRMVIPHFIQYKDAVYIFMGSVDGYDNTPKWNGEELEDTEVPQALTATYFRGRLWTAGRTDGEPGIVHYTGVGVEPDGGNFRIGDVTEPVIALYALSDIIIVFKLNGVWAIWYADDTYIANSRLKKLTDKAGALSHLAVQRYFESLRFYNNQGSYIYNPGTVKLNPDEALKVSPNVVKTSKPITDIFNDFYDVTPTVKVPYQKKEGETTGDTAWDINDFYYISGLEVDETGLYFDPPVMGAYGIAESKIIYLPKGFQWGRIVADGRWTSDVEESVCMLKLELKTADTDWREVPTTEDGSGVNKKWNFDIWSDMKDKSIYWRVQMRDFNAFISPIFKNIKFVCYYGIGAKFGSGMRRDTFYVFGSDENENRINLFHNASGWGRYSLTDPVSKSEVTPHNFINEVLWNDSYNIIGFGKNEDTGYGCLLVYNIPEDTTVEMVAQGKTGKLDFGFPNIPKKLRKIFITYKCNSAYNHLKFWDENSNLQTIDLDAASDFVIKEININTARSKWFEFEIYGKKADFHLKKMSVEVKLFKPQEV